MNVTRLLDEGLGTLIAGENYVYSAFWRDIKREQQKRHLEGGDDVRCASFVLAQLGMPTKRTFADLDEKGRWILYWY